MPRPSAILLVAALVLSPVLVAMAGCGSGNGQLQVTISSPDGGSATSPYKANDPSTFAQYKPGEDAALTVTVINHGPGSVIGVTVHVVLPPSFRYRATTGLTASGAIRTQPLDPAVNTDTPIFGVWTIAGPSAAGPGAASQLKIDLTAQVNGPPGGVPVQAFAASDAASGQTDATPYNLTVTPGAKLAALVSVSPTTEKRGGSVTYQVRVTNGGTGNAQDVAVLVTLPPVMTFATSVAPFAGNGTRNKGVNPIKDTLDVYYDGFLLPPGSKAGPGYVVIVFRATVVGSSPAPFPTLPAPGASAANVPPGTYAVDVQVTDLQGDRVSLHEVAPVAIT